ncbi:MAG: hypothetical protein PHO93_02835 [Candidatus Saccharimonadaceae bacterium]|nr:hypothetical protein [Candidatus Saccharimonadaceae bacterium]
MERMTLLDEAIRLLEISGEGTKQKALEILKRIREEQRQVVAKNGKVVRYELIWERQ